MDSNYAFAAEAALSPSAQDSTSQVFALVQRINFELRRVDAVLSFQDLCSPSSDYTIVHPLTSLLAKTKHPALLYGLLLNRSHFLQEARDDLAFQGVNMTRAALAELLAIKTLAIWDARSLELAQVLTHTYNPWDGVRQEYFESSSKPDDTEFSLLYKNGLECASSAIELAIENGAKRFVRCPPVQQFIDALYTGRLLYKPSDSRSMIKDSYKSATVELFDVATRPLLDHRILRVPRVRRFIDFCTIGVLVILFLLLQNVRMVGTVGFSEALFITFTFGFGLDEATDIKEKGTDVYFKQIWNILDLGFLAIFFIYFVLRCIGLAHNDQIMSETAFDILALGACLLLPRLCGVVLRDSIVLIGLRAMLADYATFMAFALLCSAGFLVSFSILSAGEVSVGNISWVLLKVFLGNSYIGFDIAHTFGAHIGPALMVIFAIFSNTLLLTILISILTNTFSAIQCNAVDEALFQKANSVLDLVKGDALFEFGTPANLIALPILLPASFLLSSRRFHGLNVLLIRLTQFNMLVLVHLYHRLVEYLRPSHMYLHDNDDIWTTFPKRFRRSPVSGVFSRKTTRQCRYMPSMDNAFSMTEASAPQPIRGSGGRQALGQQSISSDGSIDNLASLLTQAKGGNAVKETQSEVNTLEDHHTAMDRKLDRIEDLLSRVLAGRIPFEGELH